jgi:hypothetical protein
MDPIIASINPFPNDVRIAFQAYIQEPSYINRERIEYSKWRQLHIFLNDPTLKPTTPAESRLRHCAQMEFQLINNKLYRRPDSKFPNPRYVIVVTYLSLRSR